MKQSVTRSILRPGTGREAGDHTPEAAEAERKVREWGAPFETHLTCLDFVRELSEAPRWSPEGTRVFRGRVGPDNPKAYSEYSPPLPEQAGNGRYNVAGDPVLYLADSVDGVQRELGSDKNNLWYHEYELPADLNIADLGQYDALQVVNHAFFRAEGGEPSDFSRAIAKLVREHDGNLDGMLVPGVRANGEQEQYNNIVLFKFEEWEDWLVGKPTRL